MVAAIRAELAGVNVACVCDLALPCHGDVVLAVAAGTVDDRPDPGAVVARGVVATGEA